MDVGAAKTIGSVVLDFWSFLVAAVQCKDPDMMFVWFMTAAQCRDSDIVRVIVECRCKKII